MKKIEHRSLKFSDVGTFLKNSILAVFRGEFLLKLKVDRYFAQIAITFGFLALLILFSFIVDVNLSRVEMNKRILKDLEIENTQKKYELVTLDRRSTISTLLKENGSALAEPQQPASILAK